MKKLMVFLCAMFLVFAMTGVAGALTWAPNVSQASGWLDADKTWSGDTLLCWAASASNILSYTGWDGGPTLSTEDQIFDDFKSYWNDDAGNPWYGIDWWFTGDNDYQGTAGWAQLTDLSHTGFYTDASFTANMTWADWSNLGAIETYLSAGRGVSIRIADTWGHFLTVWGADSATGDIWVTDSDSDLNTLTNYSVTASGNLSGLYDSWDITSIYGLLPNSGGIDPILREEGPSAPVPEPATLFLLGSGLMGLFGLGRKKFFRR